VPGMVAADRYDLKTTRVNYIPADNRTGYVQSWHFTIQREITRDFVLDVGYVGNRGVKLMILGDYNQARPNNIGESLTVLARRPFQGYNDIQIAWGGGFSNYHGLQVKLEKRYSAGLYLLNSFAFSKSMDNAPGHLEVYNGDNSRVNYRDLKNEKGPGSYNQPFNNTTTLIYDVPYGRGRKFGASAHPVISGVFGGWRLTMINTMASGQPINLSCSPTSQFQVAQGTTPTYRPNLLGDFMAPEDQRSIDNYFNKANIVVPTDPRYPFGNAGRNIARGYAFYQTDFGVHKAFPVLREGRQIEFRAELFNLLNKTNFGPPDSNRSSSGFGTIRSLAGSPRQVQFALKYVF